MEEDVKLKFIFQNQKLEVKKLLVNHFVLVKEFLSEFGIDEETTSKILGALSPYGVKKLMHIIFNENTAEVELIDWAKVSYDDVDEAVTSFLSLNPRLKERLFSVGTTLTRKFLAMWVALSRGTDTK